MDTEGVKIAVDQGWQRLIAAILLQAAQDATSKKKNPDRQAAIEWLKSEDAALYCDAIGVNPEYLDRINTGQKSLERCENVRSAKKIIRKTRKGNSGASVRT